MPKHRCLDDRTLAAYLTGRLMEGESAEIESAIDACNDCHARCNAIERQLAKQWQARFSSANPASDTFGSEPELARVIQQILAPNSPSQNSASAFAETRVFADPGTPTTHAANAAEDVNRAWQARLKKIPPAEFLLKLRKSRLVTEEQLQQIAAAPNAGPGASELGVAAQASCGLTDWQLEQLARGNTALLLDNGRYELRSQIGQGGMGAVYLARHRLMNREVALKVIDPRKVTNPQLIARFKREVEASSRLQHEHIVQALDVGQHGEVSFLVLEYVHGSDLAAIVRRDGPMPPDQAAAICLQAASALAYAHSQGVVHRDIKPQNILLSTAGVTKILDMGLARIAEEGSDDHTSLTQEGALMGTVDYMPPEQARDTRTADARSDLYSLGATLFYLLSGRPPFAGGSTIDKLTRLATERPPSLTTVRPDCPLELSQLIGRLLSKQPQERPASAQEVVRELRPFAAQRVAGRAVVTAAVQAAEDGHRSRAPQSTISSPSLVFENPSALSLVRRKKPPFPWKLWAGLAAGLAAGLVLLAIVIPKRNDNSSGQTLAASGSSPTSSGAALPTTAPAAFQVDIGGHWGETYQSIALRPGGFQLTMIPAQGDPTIRHRGAIVWSPDDNFVASANGDADVRIWNTTGKTTFIYRAHPARILDVAWSPDSRTLASCDMEGNVHVWAVGSQQLISQHRIPFSNAFFQMGLAFSPDGRELAIAHNEMGIPKLIRWNWKEDRIVASWNVIGSLVCYSPSGRFLAVWGIPNHSITSRLTLFDQSGDGPLPPLQADGQNLRLLGFTANDRLLTLSEDRTRLVAWNPASGERLAEQMLPEGATVCGIGRERGSVLVLQPDQLLTIDLAPDDTEFTTQSAEFKYSGRVYNPCVSNRLRKLLCLSYSEYPGLCELLSLPGAERPQSFTIATALLQPVRELVSGRYLRLPQGVLDLETGESWSKFPEVAIVLPDGRLRGIVGARVLEWPGVDRQNEPFRVVSELEQPQEGEVSRFSTDGRSILSSNNRGYRRDVETGRVISEYEVSGNSIGHQAVDNVMASHARSASGEPMLRVVRSGEAPLDLELPLVWDFFSGSGLAISDNGRYIAAVTSGDEQALAHGERKPAWLYDLQATEIAPIELQTGLRDDLDYLAPAFTPGGRLLYLTNEVWETETRRRVWTCPEASRVRNPFAYNTQSVAAMNDERRIVIWQDNQVQVWDWPVNRKLATVFWMPNDEWALVNHVTGCWTGTDLATQYLRLGQAQSGSGMNWLTAAQFEKQSRWKNDRSRAGLASVETPQ